MNTEHLLNVARKAAAAGANILEENSVARTGRRIAFETKTSDFDLVTEIDRASERAVIDCLATTGIRIIGEESGLNAAHESSANSDWVWYVDPLDGTTNFTHGHPFCCVSIGLAREGRPVLGVVHAPLLGVRWSGGPGLPTAREDLFRNQSRPFAVSNIATLAAGLFASGFPPDRRTNPDNNIAVYEHVLKQSQSVSRCGSAALDLSLVADGTYEGFWERKIKPWDITAGVALVLAAGGRATDPWGRELVLTEGSILASNGACHEVLLAALGEKLPAAPAR